MRRSPFPTRQLAALLCIVALGLALAGLIGWLNVRGEAPLREDDPRWTAAPDPALIARGAYLAKAGNCAACHTARGGAEMAGGRPIPTPFGTLYTSNLTPDDETGIGRWSADAFWRAMHHGRSRDGRLLYPAFPYTSYTYVRREDVDALLAFLRSLAPVRQANTPHALRAPYRWQASLAVWRALFFRAGELAPVSGRSEPWHRGRYLVRGLGHCAACHAARNALGAITDEVALGGGLIPMQNWYAPSLSSDAGAGVARWPTQEVVRLLQTGVAAHASVMGPMAEVVFRSTQHLSSADLHAMAQYLQALPQRTPLPPGPATPRADALLIDRGRRLYDTHCASCHGTQGQGVPRIYPALAGNRAVTHAVTHNLIKIVSHGGFAPATAGHPRPFGMPPFGHVLSDEELAAVLSFIRQAWGNQGTPVHALDVLQARDG